MARLTFSMKQPLATAQGIDRPCCWPCTAPRLRSVWSRNTWRWCPWGKLRPQTLPVSNTRWSKTSSWQMRRILKILILLHSHFLVSKLRSPLVNFLIVSSCISWTVMWWETCSALTDSRPCRLPPSFLLYFLLQLERTTCFSFRFIPSRRENRARQRQFLLTVPHLHQGDFQVIRKRSLRIK